MNDYTIEKQDNKTIIKVILPGVSQEDISVKLEDGGVGDIEWYDSATFVYSLNAILINTGINEFIYPNKNDYKYLIAVQCSKLNKKIVFGTNSNDISSAKLDKGILTIIINGKQKFSRDIKIS